MMMNKFNKIASFLLSINTAEKVEQIEVYFDDMNSIIDLKSEFELNSESSHDEIESLFAKICEKSDNVHTKISEYFIDKQSYFSSSIEKLSVSGINESMNSMKKWNSFLLQIKRFATSRSSEKIRTDKLEKIGVGKSYTQMKEELAKKLNDLKVMISIFISRNPMKKS